MKWENLEKVMNMSAEERSQRRAAILKGYYSGKTAAQLANEFDCATQTIYAILRRQGYTPKFFGARDRTSRLLEEKVLKAQALLENPPQDLKGLQDLVSKISYILRPDSI